MNAADRLDDRFGPTFYRVQPDETDEFLADVRSAAEVLARHALSWRLMRSRRDPRDWVEFGPEFRERAALEGAAAALEGQGILERLAAFELDVSGLEEGDEPDGLEVSAFIADDGEEDLPPAGFSAVFTTEGYEPVFEVGRRARGPFGKERPPVQPADMTSAMRRAQALARALAARLDAAAPSPFRVVAQQEMVYLVDERGPSRGTNLIDLAIEDAVVSVLSDLQEELSEELTVPWPHDPARGYGFHDPGVAISAGVVDLWYGEETDRVLALPPIPLAELDA